MIQAGGWHWVHAAIQLNSSKSTWCLTSTKNTRLSWDGEKGMGGRKRVCRWGKRDNQPRLASF